MFILEGLLCHTSPDWEKIEMFHAEEPWRDAYLLESATRAFLHLHCILPLPLLEKGHLTRATIEHLVAADAAYSFGVNQPDIDHERMIARGLWLDASFFNHSCAPNVSRRRAGRRRIFRATKNIRKGEVLCITYMRKLVSAKTTVNERRMKLLATFGFVCQCKHCKNEARENEFGV